MSTNKIKYDKSLSSDIAIFTIHENELKILLVKRKYAPDAGKWALPGGFRQIGIDNDLEGIAQRRLKEETGAVAPYLEQLCTVGNALRDPRGWVTTVVYFALMAYEKVDLNVGEGVTDVRWWPVRGNSVTPDLAFDHDELVSTGIKRVSSKMEYSPIAAHLLGEEFTLPELQKVYEIILNAPLNKSHFRRAISKSDIVLDTGRLSSEGGHRRAALYTFRQGAENTLFFPRGLTRAENKK